MAITKLSNIGMPKGGGAAHLKNCISYIMNPDKTGMGKGRRKTGIPFCDLFSARGSYKRRSLCGDK